MEIREGYTLKVLMVLDAFDIGGTETHVLSLTKELIKQGVSVFVAGDPGPLESKFRKLSCEIYNYHNDMRNFEEWVRRNKINVIHAHMESSGLYAIQLSRKLAIPLVYTFHGIYYHDSVLKELLVKNSIHPSIISVSAPVQKWLEKKGFHATLVPNGIDMEEFGIGTSNLREQFNIPGHSKVILYASRLEDTKYEICKLLLMTFEQHLLKAFPDLHLLIAGGGLKAEDIKKYVNLAIRSERIQYIGNRNDMSDLYSISDFVVGTGRVALEAISCERPVIAIGTMGIFGLVTSANFSKALRYYFCDHKRYLPIDQSSMTKVIMESLLFKESNPYHGSREMRREIEKSMGISRVTTEICNIYEKMVREMEVYELR